ncbi:MULTISPECIES: STAS domain-containing protein [Microbacterium]|uniref:STAS domain-containing protein n=1 Tax=Microbacterium marmarense TaxID=3122051 RepID=A0ABU8LS72_9MICO
MNDSTRHVGPMHGDFLVHVQNGPNDETALVLSGRLDSVSAVTLREQVASLTFTESTQLTVDLRGVTFLDSAGLAALVQAHRLCGHVGAKVVFFAPDAADVWRIFDLTKFDEIFAFVAPPHAPEAKR